MSEINNVVKIMDIDFLNTTKSAFLNDHLYPRLLQQEKCFVVTANPEIVMRTREDATYKRIVKSADYVVPDGVGILLAAKHLKQPIAERLPGCDLMIDLLEFANAEGLGCYFLGAAEDVNEQAVLEAERRFPNLKVVGRQHGFFGMEDLEIVEAIKQSKPDIVFVALGFPKQEEWIDKYMDEFSKGLFMGIGGSFDILAGEVKRAPEGWIKLNLEWLYRLLQQPFRVKRIFKVFEFMGRVLLKRH